MHGINATTLSDCLSSLAEVPSISANCQVTQWSVLQQTFKIENVCLRTHLLRQNKDDSITVLLVFVRSRLTAQTDQTLVTSKNLEQLPTRPVLCSQILAGHSSASLKLFLSGTEFDCLSSTPDVAARTDNFSV